MIVLEAVQRRHDDCTYNCRLMFRARCLLYSPHRTELVSGVHSCAVFNKIQLVQKAKCVMDYAGQKVRSPTLEWKCRILSGQWNPKAEFYLGQIQNLSWTHGRDLLKNGKKVTGIVDSSPMKREMRDGGGFSGGYRTDQAR